MRRTHAALVSYHDKPISSCSQLLITKKPAAFDYVAIDAGGLVGGALRLSKSLNSEQRRHREVARHVAQGVMQILKRIDCRSSLLIALDGAESLARAHATRSATLTRRVESRLARLPGTALMQAVEERLVRMIPDRQGFPREVVFAGTCVAGCAEEKMGAWALDLACRDDFGRTNAQLRLSLSTGADSGADTPSLALVGAQELYLVALGMTPYYSVSSLVQGSGADVRQTHIASVLEWLGLTQYATAGHSELVARARTDMLFLLLLCQGGSAAELQPLVGVRLQAVFDAYHELVLKPRLHSSESGASKELHSTHDAPDKRVPFLFEDAPHHELTLNVEALLAVLRSCVAGSMVSARQDVQASAALELVLQAHASICLGYTPDPYFLPLQGAASSAVSLSGITASVFVSHLLFCCQSRGQTHKSASRTWSDESASAPPDNACLLPQSQPGAAATDPSHVVTSAEGQETSRTVPLAADAEQPPDGLSTAPGAEESLAKGSPSQTAGPSTATVAEERHPGTAASQAVLLRDGGPASEERTTEAEAGGDVAAMPPWNSAQPLTAGEYTALCHSTTPGVDVALQTYLGSPTAAAALLSRLRDSEPSLLPPSSLPPSAYSAAADPLKLITQVDASSALRLVRTVLARGVVDPHNAHQCLCLSPSLCWTQSLRSKVWHMRYVDLGTRARQHEIRRVRNARAGVAMALPVSDDGPTHFDAARDRWTSVPSFPFNEGSEAPHVAAVTAAPSAAGERGDTLKVLSWNVMFDRYSGQPTPLGMPGIDWCSPQRYPVLARCILEEDADVVAMQETEPVFLRYLMDQPWCRERYFLSCAPESAVVNPWGVAMLVHRHRLPALRLTHVNVPAWSGHAAFMPVITLRAPHGPVHCVAVHLLAPFTKNAANARTAQDAALRLLLTKGIAGSAEDCIAMGDFNDWPARAFEMPVGTQYRECWPLVHPKDPGWTIAETNTFCKLKIEEEFFGRSDKVFVRSARLRPIAAHLVGTKSVNELNGDQAAPAYLFPSDHYGVSMTFAL